MWLNCYKLIFCPWPISQPYSTSTTYSLKYWWPHYEIQHSRQKQSIYGIKKFISWAQANKIVQTLIFILLLVASQFCRGCHHLFELTAKEVSNRSNLSHSNQWGQKKYKIKHNRSTLRINFAKSVPVMVYMKGKLKAQSYHRMRFFLKPS